MILFHTEVLTQTKEVYMDPFTRSRLKTAFSLVAKRMRGLLALAVFVGLVVVFIIYGIPRLKLPHINLQAVLVVVVCIVCALAAFALIIQRAYKPSKLKKEGTDTPDTKVLTWWDRLLNRFKDIPKKYIRSWMLYPIFIYGIWFAIVLYLLQSFFPDYYNWLWIDDVKVFWAIPTIVLIVVMVYEYKRFVPGVGATILLLVVTQATWNSYKKTNMWKTEQVAREIRKAEKAQAALAYRQSLIRKVEVVAKPGEWSAIQDIPIGWVAWVTPSGQIEYEADGKPPQKDGPGQATDYGRTTRRVRFRSLEQNSVIVTMTFEQNKW